MVVAGCSETLSLPFAAGSSVSFPAMVSQLSFSPRRNNRKAKRVWMRSAVSGPPRAASISRAGSWKPLISSRLTSSTTASRTSSPMLATVGMGLVMGGPK